MCRAPLVRGCYGKPSVWRSCSTSNSSASYTAGRTPLCGEAEPLAPALQLRETIRQLATLLQAGLPLAEGLSLLAQQQSHAQWQALLEALGRELAQGVAFSPRWRSGPRLSRHYIWR